MTTPPDDALDLIAAALRQDENVRGGNAGPLAALATVRDEIDDLCYRHCELGESLSEEEIDRLIDTAAAAHALAADLDNRLRGAAS